ncbi:MAG: hypothetical protein M9939_26540 [Mesorhizobium sp.]|nr:hypothetical protein [Mesorhizobium sp.]MCO5164652.1 hypothetical protein [Mesorhizobium sp.]
MASMTIESLVPDAEVMVFHRGPPGPGAELRLYPAINPTHIQWRQENGAWADLVALDDLMGPAGPVGITWRSEGWDSISEFSERDVLLHDDIIWIALSDNTNQEPGDSDSPWDILLDGTSIASDRELAEAARDKAQDWAEKAEDVTVEPGSYSAKHWAAKAEDEKDLAATAKTGAENARDKAEKWAEEDEDIEVEPGSYSAKHWAEKAQDAATGGAGSISVTPAGNIAATNVQAALEELDTEKAKVGAVASSGLTMATARVLGRVTAGTGGLEELTAAQIRTFVGNASDTVAALIELATQSEVNAGTDTGRAVVPATLLGFTKARPGNVAYTVKTDTFSTSSGSFVDVTGLSVSITPLISTSRILVFGMVNVGPYGANYPAFVKLVRDSTDLSVGGAAGSRSRTMALAQSDRLVAVPLLDIDSPGTTSVITYKVQMKTRTGGGINAHINRDTTDTDNVDFGRAASVLIAMEIV